jgi:transposase
MEARAEHLAADVLARRQGPSIVPQRDLLATLRRRKGRVRELVAGHPGLEVITSALLSVRAVLRRQLNDFKRRLRTIARTDTRARLLMTTPGVGVIVAFDLCLRDRRPITVQIVESRLVFRMTPTRYQSGETDNSGRISKNRDGSVRAVLYEAGHLILTRPLKGRAGRYGSPSGQG